MFGKNKKNSKQNNKSSEAGTDMSAKNATTKNSCKSSRSSGTKACGSSRSSSTKNSKNN